MIVVVAGPTASGKSALAVDLALALTAVGRPAEIVNADSMLVYRGMDIGTAKPTPAERRGIPHHLVDILEVTEPATVADFQALARTAIAQARSRGVVPVVVGGSALYLRAILDEFVFPGTDAAVRSRLEAELAEIGPEALHAQLRSVDAAVAAQMLPANGRRTVRALEVLELTGAWNPELPGFTYALPDVVQIGLEMPRDELDARIATRVDAMWEAGFVAEVRALERRGLRQGRTASRALGYRQILDLLGGEIDESSARRQTVFGTRRFARRQAGWFRKDPRIHWLPATGPELTAHALRLLEDVSH
ncbi:MAG: tRNA (adenosine(37)-N6)-dimethylallyltransferase MiaA [Propionibacteriaceae bacterium]